MTTQESGAAPADPAQGVAEAGPRDAFALAAIKIAAAQERSATAVERLCEIVERLVVAAETAATAPPVDEADDLARSIYDEALRDVRGGDGGEGR